jgi:RNA polymerase sigma factor (sigma-70 family)
MSTATQPPTEAWTALLQQAASESCEPLLRRVRPLARALILDRIRDPEAAEDLVQEALSDLVHGLLALRDPQSFLSWLRTVCLNRCRMYWRRREVEYAAFDENATPLRAQDAYAVTAQREAWRQLRRALEELPERSRLALLMHALDDCPYREIAEALGESEVGVRVRVHRARLRLRELLRPSLYEPEEDHHV